MNARCSFPLVLGLLGVSAPLVGVRGQEQPPRLTVVLVVDQMRADHLTRFAGHYERGLDRLLRTGAVFTEALHDHARSETSPGHATIATGSFPSAHGIVANEWYDVALRPVHVFSRRRHHPYSRSPGCARTLPQQTPATGRDKGGRSDQGAGDAEPKGRLACPSNGRLHHGGLASPNRCSQLEPQPAFRFPGCPLPTTERSIR